MLALVKTRRWLSFTAFVVLAITGFGLLSRWQWDRADERRVERVAISQAQVLDRVDSVTDLGEFTRVQVSGTFADEKTQLVRQRPLDGGNGYWVMTPLSRSDWRSNGASDMGAAWVAWGINHRDGGAVHPARSPRGNHSHRCDSKL